MMENKSSTGGELLLIFTRNPEVGKVKKRLATDIGDQAALKIYNHLLQHTVNITKNLQVEKWVCYSEEIPGEDIWDKNVFRKKLQQGEDLGERMENAFSSGFEAGFSSIIIIGSDLYDLSEEDLKIAFLTLQHSEAVIGPATDGGYYLLGLKSLPSQVFRNKNWGSNTVLENTLKDLNNLKLKQLEARNDIDRFEDLKQHPDLLKMIKT
ncbi:TIGR04282 family arsenosugar biosynthesis glycosyltransferase [Salinimicrobium xinjiangense]|uniref:TIGR04282 family arsenosugar biosynthesis glycosyltransferase n=1 Tax=Salinimicrobium xinjiangense TaxID=438596 RepID=UPI000428126B|nr:TIGR04282 family arsenosugar biosynthesis glycosyltransferase [Salinimicrobium xinjiangense]